MAQLHVTHHAVKQKCYLEAKNREATVEGIEYNLIDNNGARAGLLWPREGMEHCFTNKPADAVCLVMVHAVNLFELKALTIACLETLIHKQALGILISNRALEVIRALDEEMGGITIKLASHETKITVDIEQPQDGSEHPNPDPESAAEPF
jgi:hypothetical protein